MNDIVSPDDRPDVDAAYREAAAREGGGPNDAVRAAVLARAAALAAERRSHRPAIRHTSRHAAWRFAGLAAAAAIAGVLVWPRADRTPTPTAEVARSRSEVRQYAAAPAPFAAAPAVPTAKAVPVPAAVPAAPRSTAAPAVRAQAPEPNAVAGTAALTHTPPAAAAVALGASSPAESGTNLWQAAAAGDVAQLQSILASPAAGIRLDVNARDAEGCTALMRATLASSAPAVQFLLAHGADPKIGDLSGRTPMEVALAQGRADIADSLRVAPAH
jgi:hypothetical protein